MFRKIITELLYSPALAERVGEYSRQLRQEKTSRRIGLIFIGLAVAMQAFIALLPPEAANTVNSVAIIDDTIETKDAYLQYYDQNSKEIHSLLASLGINRTDIENARLAEVTISNNLQLWSTTPVGKGASTSYEFRTYSDKSKLAYYQPLQPLRDFLNVNKNNTVLAYTGASDTLGWFAILKSGGNLITKGAVTMPCYDSLPLTDSNHCGVAPSLSLSVRDMSTNQPVGSNKVAASGHAIYTLSITNSNPDEAITFSPNIHIDDIVEYAQVVDTGGGGLDAPSKTISWTPILLQPGEHVERNFIVRLFDTIPSFARGQYDTMSYDCTISATFGTTVDVPVICPFTKRIEQAIHNLPTIPTSANLLFAAGLIITSSYLYLYARQLAAELRIIKRRRAGGL